MAAGQNISFRVDADLLERLDSSARQAGQTRTEYITSWLPDTYEPASRNAETVSKQQRSNGR